MPVDNLPGERIESLVDELEGIIEEARPPFGKGAQQKIIETDAVSYTHLTLPTTPYV